MAGGTSQPGSRASHLAPGTRYLVFLSAQQKGGRSPDTHTQRQPGQSPGVGRAVLCTMVIYTEGVPHRVLPGTALTSHKGALVPKVCHIPPLLAPLRTWPYYPQASPPPHLPTLTLCGASSTAGGGDGGGGGARRGPHAPRPRPLGIRARRAPAPTPATSPACPCCLVPHQSTPLATSFASSRNARCRGNQRLPTHRSLSGNKHEARREFLPFPQHHAVLLQRRG